jgi:hypothetical protein
MSTPRSAFARFVLSALAAGSLLSAGCEETGARMDPDLGADVDGGTSTTASLTYRPEGCSYDVSTPNIRNGVVDRHADDVGATPTPDHVHVSFAGPTTSSFAVNWRTRGIDTRAAVVVYGTDEAAVRGYVEGDLPAGVLRQTGHSMIYGRERNFRVHEAHVCGLTAGTRYFYKVGAPGAWSGVYDVATSPEIGTTSAWRFAVTGDSRNEPAIWAETQKRVHDEGVDLQLFSGDAVVFGTNQGEWDAFFEASNMGVAVTDVLARVPFMTANGNHDALAVNYLAQFAMPQDSTPSEEYFSFDYGNAHIVFLNDTTTAATITRQREWMTEDLRRVDRARTPWVFVVHHRPTYTCATAHDPDINLRTQWQPVYDMFEVDFVFNGHNHNYERTLPIRGFASGTNEGVSFNTMNGIPLDSAGRVVGTVYVTAAGAGAPLYGVDPSSTSYTYIAESVRNYVIVEIEGKRMRYRAYRLNGTEIDAFEYTKP